MIYRASGLRLSAHVVAFWATVLGVGPALGQGTPPPLQLDPVVVDERLARDRVRSTTDLTAPNTTGSRLPGTARDVPGSVESINQATIQERGKRTWIDALEGMTGFTAAVRPGAAGVMSARGFTENSFALLYDGIRVSSTTITTRTYDAFMFDRIEVLRGPASVLFGESAVGGAINLVRKAPGPQPQPLEVMTTLSMPAGLRVGVGKGGRIGDSLTWRLDGVINAERGTANGSELRSGNISGAIRWQVTDHIATGLDFDYLRADVDDAYWGTPLVRGAIDTSLRDVNYNNLPNNRYNDRVLWLRWKTEAELGNGFRLRNQLWNYQAYRDWVNVYRFAYVPAGASCSFRGSTLVNGTGRDQVCRQTWENLGYDHRFTGNRLEAAFDGAIAGRAVSAVAGVEYADTRWDSPRNEVTSLQLVDPYSPPATDFFSRGTARTQNVQAKLRQLAGFAELRVEVFPGLKLVGGVRQDWLWVDYDRQPANQRYERSFTPTTWRVGAVWNVWKEGTAYAAFATAIEPRFALFTLGVTDTPFSLTSARQFEVGFKQGFGGGRGEITAAVYRIEKKDIPSTDPATGATVQIGRQSSTGFEIGGSFRPIDSLRLFANAAMVSARFDEFRSGSSNFAGNQPPNVPRWVLNGGVTWAPVADWTVGGIVNYRSSIVANDANTVRLPGAAIADVFATWAFQPNADVTFRIHNITDTVYAAWATDANYVVLGRPRTFELGLRARF